MPGPLVRSGRAWPGHILSTPLTTLGGPGACTPSRVPRGSRCTTCYAQADEQLHRIDNRTVSAFLHLSVVGRRPRLAVYVRPHGRVGRWYLRGIDPFRRAIIYPSLLAAGRRAVQRLAG